MRISDVVPAMFILALSALAVFGTWRLGYWSETTPGPAFLPFWVAGIAVLVVILRLVEAWRDAGADAHVGAEWPDRPALVRASLAFGGLVAIALLTPLLGMVPSVVLFIAFLLLVVLRRPLWPSLATVAITGGVIQGIFVWWLGLPLPVGAIGF